MKKGKPVVFVLGGGLAGMAACDLLSERFSVTLLEKEAALGGLASSFEHNDRYIPKHYHHVFWTDTVTRKLVASLGIKDWSWTRIKVGICANKNTYGFTDPISLAKFSYLSLWGRIRYGLFGAYAFTIMNPARLSDTVGAENWLLKYAGREATAKVFQNLYARNKFNIPLSQISAKQFAYRLKEKEALGVFGYPKASLNEVISRLEAKIARKAKIVKKARIAKIDFKKKAITYNNKTCRFDILLNTIPTPEFLKVSGGLPPGYTAKLGKIRYCPAVTVAFATKELFSPNYFTIVFNERIHTIFQHSLLLDNYGYKVAWALRYGGSEADLGLSDDEIREKYLMVVKEYYPKARILWSRVFRERYAEPVYDINYAKYKPDIRSPVSSLYHAGIAESYPKIRTMNSTLESGIKAAKAILGDYQ